MGIRIRRVAVLGAGVMGQGIAAQLANAGIPSYLFDIAPNELTEAEEAAGLTLEDRAVRNRISQAGVTSMVKSRPALLYHKDLAAYVTPCNYEDDKDKLSECDWIVEVVVERLDIKLKVFEMVDEHRKPGSVVSSNTSGLSVAAMSEGRSDDFRTHFMVTHFFNPVRYMRLLEFVPGEDTDPELFAAMARFGEKVLGKGIVYAKDTPNFIANRIGTFGMASVFHWIAEYGMGVTETDKVFGPAMGRPKSAIFRTADIVGLDTLAHVFGTIEQNCTDDPWRERFAVPAAIGGMLDKGYLGAKTRAGFYRKNAEGAIQAIDLETLEYQDQPRLKLDAVGAARGKETSGEKLAAMVWFDDEYGTLAWKVTAEISIYSAQLLGEIADDIVNVDRALRWGFNFDLGPFEAWDAIGVEKSVERMKEEGFEVPEVVDRMLAESDGTWYTVRDGVRYYWDVTAGEYAPVPVDERLIFIDDLKARDKVLATNVGATLYDLGDGVGLVEFHTKMNAIDGQIGEMLQIAVEKVNSGELVGLVIGNEADNFSVGANVGLVGMLAMNQQFDEVEELVKSLQDTLMALRYCEGPVVTAPRGMALGGGCEIVMHGDAARAAAESYVGLVELGVGLIPAAGGCKEMAMRYYGSIPPGVNADLFPYMERLFRIIGTASVATSAEEAREFGFLRPTDRVTLNPDAVLADAKADVLAMVASGYTPPKPRTVAVPGRDGIAALKIAVHTMKEGGYISEYDEYLGTVLGSVLCGGDVPPGTVRTEQEFLDLEREAFVGLCGQEKTMARIMHMLEKGKPLRN
ncbi:MAG: 3-hydroxyacyl-CoA dehydrogenase/enoyl-CoA hydratase family protein [Actinobacteria bacterium]|nr:3-hydroxyacyl-CoA dehydrogenase/enoyl-CoA hydratase family protein [Actinomycetota bacterium]